MSGPYQVAALNGVGGLVYSMQRREVILHDGSHLTAEQTATGTVTLTRITNPGSSAPTMTALAQTFSNASSVTTPTDLFAIPGSGTTDVWVVLCSNGSGTTAVTVAHATFDGTTWTWDNTGTQAATLSTTGNGVASIIWTGGTGSTGNVIVVYRDTAYSLQVVYTPIKAGGSGWVAKATLNTTASTGSHLFPLLVHDANLGGAGVGATACIYALTASGNGTEQLAVRTLLDSATSPAVANWGTETKQAATVLNLGAGNLTACVDSANGKLYVAFATSLVGTGGSGNAGVHVIPITIASNGTPTWGTLVFLTGSTSAWTALALGVDGSGKLYLDATTGTVGTSGSIQNSTSTDSGATWSAFASVTAAATTGDGYPHFPCGGLGQAFGGFVPRLFQRGTASFTAQLDNTQAANAAGAISESTTVSATPTRTVNYARSVTETLTAATDTVSIPGPGLTISTQTATIANLTSPFTARNGSQAETDTNWQDASGNGWYWGYRPNYGGMPFSAWGEIDSGVTSITQDADTTRPDGIIHFLTALAGNFAGSEDPQFVVTELAPTGTPFRRRYQCVGTAADGNGFTWTITASAYPGDPGFVFYRVEMTNPTGSGITLDSPGYDFAVIGGLTQVSQGGATAWAPAGAFYANVGAGAATAMPIDSSAATLEPDFTYVTPAGGSGLVDGIFAIKKTGVLSLGSASTPKIGYTQNGSRMKIHITAVTGGAFPASTTRVMNYIGGLRRSLTFADMQSVAADILNPDTSGAMTNVSGCTVSAFDYDQGWYPLTFSGTTTCQLQHSIAGAVDKRWVPAYRISGWTSADVRLKLASTFLNVGVDYLRYVDTVNQVAYVKLLKTIVASGAGAGQLNNAILLFAPTAGAAYSASVSETITTSDSVARTTTTPRAISESISAASDSVSRVASLARGIAESVAGVADAVARGFSGSRSPSESTSTSDGAARTVAAGRSLTETIAGAADAVTRSSPAARSVAEAVTTTDAPTRSFTGARAPSESLVAASDVPTRSVARTRSVAESIPAASDSVTGIRIIGRTITEALSGATDTVARAYTGARALAETLTAAIDSVVGTRIRPYFQDVTLSLPITISPDYVGDTHGSKSFTITSSTGAFDISGATLTCKFDSADPAQPAFAGTGTFTVTDALNGAFTYHASSADLAAAGLYQFQVLFTFVDGTKRHSNIVIWRVLQAI